MGVPARRSWVIGCLALAVACTSPSPSGNGGPSSNPTGSASGPDAFVRACETRVSGELGAWRKDAIILGPIGFLGLGGAGREPNAAFNPHGRRYRSLKALAVVSNIGPVTVSIDPADLGRVRLLYDPSVWNDRNLYPLEAGDAATTFTPCHDGRTTQFNGGFLVTGRTCATLVATVEGRRPVRRTVSFGASSCPS
jgi:hypothetical protein